MSFSPPKLRSAVYKKVVDNALKMNTRCPIECEKVVSFTNGGNTNDHFIVQKEILKSIMKVADSINSCKRCFADVNDNLHNCSVCTAKYHEDQKSKYQFNA
jgi:hypothetical protein